MRFIHYQTIGSTSLVAKNLAEEEFKQQFVRPIAGEEFEPVWISADEQTAGRGRRGRAWVSSTGNLFCTGLFEFHGTPSEAARLSFVAAIALAQTLLNYIPTQKIAIKWPNDVLVDGAKIAGILLENGQVGDRMWVSVGIGVNITTSPDIQDYATTNLRAHCGQDNIKAVTAQSFLSVLADKFEHWRQVYQEQGFDPIRSQWQSQALGLEGNEQSPKKTTVNLSNKIITGVALGLDNDGALLVRPDGGGGVIKIHAGDVFFSNKAG